MNAAFVQSWISAWNRHDFDAVLTHYNDSVKFTSPKAQQVVGKSTIEGKDALRRYWSKGMETFPDLLFELDHWIWDEQRHELVIVYSARLGGTVSRVCEILCFGSDGIVFNGEAMYGATLS
jgi:hypothetical protein